MAVVLTPRGIVAAYKSLIIHLFYAYFVHYYVIKHLLSHYLFKNRPFVCANSLAIAAAPGKLNDGVARLGACPSNGKQAYLGYLTP